MSLEDLDLILKKYPIIATWPVSALKSGPAIVEQSYAAHAKTHLSLGDTQTYVDALFRWVGGTNKGAFVGAVEGDYGEGKTSFLVHLWAESLERRVFAVPPFEWASLADAVDGVAAWIQHILGPTHPELARKAQRLHERFRQETIEDVAARTAKESKREYETVLETLQTAQQQGGYVVSETSAARFLDYCAEATELVSKAGYVGLLVLLDEPEVAAKQSSKEKVALWLFDLANELHRREGSYGVFVSMPTNFLADLARRYPALTARLQVRNCFPRLRDIYGPDFARDLWARYVTEFELGEVGERIVSPVALEAIGQLGSSQRSDLSYGPRTVVSAFNRMVYYYRETGKTYEPGNLVEDCLNDEIMIKGQYPSIVREVLRSPEVNDNNEEAVRFVAAFPNGLRMEIARDRDVSETLLQLCRRRSLAYKTAYAFGLHALRVSDTAQVDPLRELILDIANEYAPSRDAFEYAMQAFEGHVAPLLFRPRQGQQLVGWEEWSPWRSSKRGARVTALIGAFQQTQQHYPRRAVLIVTGSLETPINDVPVPKPPTASGPLQYDAAFHFRFRWHNEQEPTPEKLSISMGDLAKKHFPLIRLTIDLQDHAIEHDILAELLEPSTLSPVFLLYLLGRMDAEPLPKEVEAQWHALRNSVLRELVPAIFAHDLASLATEQLGQPVSGSGLEFLGSVFHRILQIRYPNYSTLIRAPQWEQKVDAYIRALKSSDIPLACKRGREPWLAQGDLAPKALGTSRMNLTGGGFAGFEDLLVIQTTGSRNAPLEVTFRIHPLEQQIMDLITAESETGRRKLKIGGKECWWVPVDELFAVIRESGYGTAELMKIIEIGTSRGSFDVTDYRGERVLYCMPIDPEQMREQLHAKLSDLLAEIELFRQVPGFTTSFEAKPIEAEIDALEDDADYDRIVTLLNREFERLHGKLPTLYSALQQRFTDLRSHIKDIPGQLRSARGVANLATLPVGKSRWCADLSKYIVGNLKKSVDELAAGAARLADQLANRIAQYQTPSQKPKEAVEFLLQGYASLVDLASTTRHVRQQRDDLMVNLQDYEEWLRMLRRSDQVYEALLQLQGEELHKSKADVLLSDHDKVCEEITDHLEVRNVLGLEAHKQFTAALDDIDEERRRYLNELKSGFDKRKDAVNRVLAALNLDRRVPTVFNPMDVEGCYTAMYELAAQHIREAAIAQPEAEADMQQRELVYAKEVLKSVEPPAADPLLERLHGARTRLAGFEDVVTKSWVQAITEPDAEEDPVTEISQALTETLAAVREVRQLIRERTKATVPGDGRSKFMHDLLPERGGVDLKQLVLEMMADTGDPSRALDESLECLIELFKRNCVQISIERRRA